MSEVVLTGPAVDGQAVRKIPLREGCLFSVHGHSDSVLPSRVRAVQFSLVLRCGVNRDIHRDVERLEFPDQHAGLSDCLSAVRLVHRLFLQHGVPAAAGRVGNVDV